MSVVQLTNKSGLSPRMYQAVNDLSCAIQAAIDDASDTGVPLEMIMGVLDCHKFAMFMQSGDEE